jgi:hypothetical protein
LFKIVLLAMLALIVALTLSLELSFAVITALAVAALGIMITTLYRANRVEVRRHIE